MGRFSRSSFLSSSSFQQLRRQFSSESESVKRVRNIWISGLNDVPSKGSSIEDRLQDDLSREEEIYYAKFYGFIKHTICYIQGRRPAVNSFVWKNYQNYLINIIHSPDFTLEEVQTALPAFDCGAILALSSVAGVQTQSITFDKLMLRYQLPRLVFINSLHHKGANPWQVIDQARSKLQHHSAAIQVPIGLEDDFKGLVDLVQLKAYYFHVEKVVVEQVPEEVPEDMEDFVSEKRRELIQTVSEVDDKLAEAFRCDKPISAPDLEEAVRRATIAHKFIPVFMGDAFKYNKGLQLLLDGVTNYLPCPIEASAYALERSKNGEKRTLVASAFTLKENWKHGQITYLRIYEGVIRKGDFITNVNTGKTFEVPRLFRKRNDCLDVIQEAHAGEIVAVFNVNYVPGDTFTDGLVRYTRSTSVDASKYLNGFQGKDSTTSRDGLEMGEESPVSRGYANDRLIMINLINSEIMC
ncbi:putative translation protein, beta-barrel [Medicago truncatula]|uniref:Elongation factor Tu domain protein n=2 Tax=Medicago truncatula TaxID=3880 RepID=G7IJS5_MEDTR|nr:elongation factor G, mitochondrial isoform X1 [Medicago truncatula]AES64728.2 elongation factor Tu domain protein [Medicago truncatula]RHN72812.1 putative translation protein, beta-barrel [Medicago truncatula]